MKYNIISGIANAIMLGTSAGVNNIDNTKITNTATFQLSIYESVSINPIRCKNSITSGN